MTDEGLAEFDQSRATRVRSALADSEERFRHLVDGVEDYAIVLLDPTGAVTTWNRGAERIKGYLPGEILGKNFSVFYTPEALAKAWPQYELSVARESGRFSDEGWRVRKDGTQFWASVVISAIHGKDGLLRGFLKITRDLTERRRADEALRLSEERFRALVEGVEDYAIFLLDSEGRVESWNRGAEILKGYSASEIVGQHFSVFYTPEAILQDKPAWELRTAIEHGRIEDEGWRVRKDGTRFWANVVITALHDPAGNLRGFAKVTRDMTERRNLEALLEVDRQKDEFLAVLAHELRNPLAPIRNALEVMMQPGVTSDASTRARDIAERQLKNMTRLLDDLLDVTRIREGRIELRREVVGLSAILDAAVETSQPLISERQHQLTVERPPEEAWIEGDPVRLSQALTNLLNNAAKYTDPGGRIELAASRSDGDAVIRVRDSGIGIDPMMLPHVFDLFVQVAERSEVSAGGVGIGLTLAKRIVELHGGRLDALSAGVGLGSEFVIRLPVVEAGRAQSSKVPRAGEKSPARPTALRVLVVDDNVDAADGLALLLDLQGYETRVAYDGATALEAVKEFRPEVAILDIGMPLMDGYELARRLREAPETEKTVLVAMTGWGQVEDLRKAREAGFHHHLVKPSEPATLEKLLADLASSRNR
jgi:PAS domain S-box-containing protein